MTLNQHFWGADYDNAIMKFLEQFDTVPKVQAAKKCGTAVCLQTLSGVVNHMAPAGQRMPELTAISLLEQPVCILNFLSILCVFFVFDATGAGPQTAHDPVLRRTNRCRIRLQKECRWFAFIRFFEAHKYEYVCSQRIGTRLLVGQRGNLPFDMSRGKCSVLFECNRFPVAYDAS